MSVNRETLDQEYLGRVRGWKFLTPDEREGFAAAEAAGDLKTLNRLQKRGRRRDKFCCFEICSERLIIDGCIHLGGPEGFEDCTCAVDCLDSDPLYKYVTNLELPAGSFRSALDGKAMDAFEQAATWRHHHPDRPLREWIVADKAQRARHAARLRERQELAAQAGETVHAPAMSTTVDIPVGTPEPPEPEPETREAKASRDFRRRGRVPRYWDKPGGDGAWWDRVF